MALKVEGASVGAGDIVGSLKLANASASIEDKAKVTLFKVNLTANGLKMGTDGFLVTNQEAEVPEADEESVGAFVHFNIDDDNSSDTVGTRTAGLPKYPGADVTDNTGTVSGEDDLKLAKIDIDGLSPLNKGKVVLSASGNIRVWKDATKGSGNIILSGTAPQKEWDLSNAAQLADFNAVKSQLYVEGKEANASGSLTVSFQRQLGGTWQSMGTDVIKYGSVAANDGAQPFVSPTDGSHSRAEFKGAWPNLVDCEYSVLGPRDVTFNCWAWSTQRTDAWVGAPFYTDTTIPADVTVNKIVRPNGVTYIDIGRMWGGNLGPWTATDFDAYYAAAGMEPGQTLPNYKFVPTTSIDDAEILLYSIGADITHGARLHSPTQSGMGKWRMFESKCGQWERIEHLFDQLDGGDYGSVFRKYKRVPR